ncbi:MAG: glycosyltransferase [Planctomycetaceae bacterium]
MNFVNFVNAVDAVSIGVWKAALWTAPALLKDYGISTHLWARLESGWCPQDHSVSFVQDVSTTSRRELRSLFLSRYSPSDTVIVSHGSWKFPTTWASEFAGLGFPWIYVPQGMLEPWSLQQHAFRKRLYWKLVESRCVRSASVVRAVSSSEKANLQALLRDADVRLIPNGIESVSEEFRNANSGTTFLFLGRLHHKKGSARLVESFCRLPQSTAPGVELIVAGPDQGELARIRSLQSQFPNANLRYVGPVYGKAKEELLQTAQFFVLPSHSEGFPTSVVEAMGAGCIPLISDGCNFPEAKRNGVCLNIGTSVESIGSGIAQALQMDSLQRAQMSEAARLFILRHYTARPVAEAQAAVFHELTDRSGKTTHRKVA